MANEVPPRAVEHLRRLDERSTRACRDHPDTIEAAGHRARAFGYRTALVHVLGCDADELDAILDGVLPSVEAVTGLVPVWLPVHDVRLWSTTSSDPALYSRRTRLREAAAVTVRELDR